MSSRVLSVLVAVLLGPTALGQVDPRVDSAASDGWVGDEPNASSGDLPYCSPRDPWQGPDPSCTYPADANGLGPERRVEPGPVLAVMFARDVCANRLAVCADLVDATLLASLDGPSTILPGLGRWVAWHGAFLDVDGDGWIDHSSSADRVHVSTRGDCEPTPRTDDPDGLGAPQGENTGVSVRCPSTVEWTPLPTATIVAYVTPADHNSRADLVNARFENGTRDPDFTFQPTAVEGRPTGRYFAPESNLDYVVIDNGVLETTVIEAISDPATIPFGTRTVDQGPRSLVEVDVYHAVDPTLEALYANNVVAPLNALGCDVEFTWLARACPTTTERAVSLVSETVLEPLDDDPVLAAVEDALSGRSPRTAPIVGPVEARFEPPWPREGAGIDYGEPHLYFDQRLIAATASVSALAIGRESTTFSSTALGDGRYRPLAQTELHARLGVWHDLDGDGVIGSYTPPDPDDGCGADPYDCGRVSDPNAYTFEESGGEYQPLCGLDQAEHGRNADGVYLATLTTPDGRWGSGVYVLTDRRDATDADADRLDDDGRSQFDPYDDLVLDASDGDVGRTLVTQGRIDVHMLCHDGSGVYAGYERLVFVDGTNRGFSVLTAGLAEARYTLGYGPIEEAATDDDVYAPFP